MKTTSQALSEIQQKTIELNEYVQSIVSLEKPKFSIGDVVLDRKQNKYVVVGVQVSSLCQYEYQCVCDRSRVIERFFFEAEIRK